MAQLPTIQETQAAIDSPRLPVPVLETEITPHPRAVYFEVEKVQPPSGLYFSGDDQLLVLGASSVSGAVFQVIGSILLPTGEIVPFKNSYGFTLSRVLQSATLPLPECFLLSVTGIVISPAQVRGQTFIQLYAMRGQSGALTLTQQLLNSYIDDMFAASWPVGLMEHSVTPPGVFRSITGAAPAAGVEISETVPTGARWRLISMRAKLTTSAVVATRRPQIEFTDGTNIWFHNPSGSTLTAGSNQTWVFAPIGVNNTATQNGPVDLVPEEAWLMAGWKIRTVTLSLDAGDQWSAPQYVVEEVLDV